jgi:hypothetical protein
MVPACAYLTIFLERVKYLQDVLYLLFDALAAKERPFHHFSSPYGKCFFLHNPPQNAVRE